MKSEIMFVEISCRRRMHKNGMHAQMARYFSILTAKRLDRFQSREGHMSLYIVKDASDDLSVKRGEPGQCGRVRVRV